MKYEQFLSMSFFTVGIALGYFGSLILFLAWIPAPMCAYIWRSQERSSWLILWATAIGILLGGLPLWLVFTTGPESLHAPWLIPSTPIAFILGAVMSDVIQWLRQMRRPTHVMICW